MPGASELIQQYEAAPPVSGILDGIDPALPAAIFRPTHAVELENLRVARGLLAETRYGMSLWKTVGGAGNFRLLYDFYTRAGVAYRLAVRGGSLYTQTGGGAFGSVASGLTDNPVHATTIGDYVYFTDQDSGHALKKWSVAGGVADVTQPARPTAAPRVTPRTYDTLEAWSGAAPFGWSQVDKNGAAQTDVVISDGTAAEASPIGGTTAKLAFNTSSRDDRVRENTANERVPSLNIAMWVQQSMAKYRMAFEIGRNAEGDFPYPLELPDKDEWYPFFVPIGALGTLNYKRFRVVKAPNSNQTLYVSPIVLPGNLQGEYRYIYTHVASAAGTESEPSDVSDKLDLTKIGVNYKAETAAAFQKSAAVMPTSDAGTDATTDQVKIYRNGGSASALIKDSAGNDVWTYVGTINDWEKALGAAAAAGQGYIDVANANTTGVAAGDWLVIGKTATGTNAEEIVKVQSVGAAGSGATGALARITLTSNLLYAHTTGQNAQVIFVDNNSDVTVDSSITVDRERDNPPAGALWISTSSDGRLWIFGWGASPLGVAVSNKATPQRPRDWEVFPDGVDPQTRRHPLQGFRFEIGGDSSGDRIMWGGFFRNVPTVITTRAVYQIFATSQTTWGPEAVVRVLDVGCLAGETVTEVDGTLFWVAPGATPRVVRWDGSSPVVDVSHQRINQQLSDAPTAYWSSWWAKPHTKRDGSYYCLWMVPTGQTTPVRGLQYCVPRDAWEAVTYYDSAPALIPFATGSAQVGPSDKSVLMAACSATGKIYQLDDPSVTTDDSQGIRVTLRTKRYEFAEGSLSKLTRVLFRLAAVTDSLTLTVTVGGSEYGDASHSYTLSLSGAGDVEGLQRLHFDLKGRWVEFYITGTVTNRPKLRQLQWLARIIRHGRNKAGG